MASSQGKLELKPRADAYEAPRIEAELDEIHALERDTALLHQALRDGSTISNWINERPDANGIPRLPPAKLLLYLGAKQKSGRLSALVAKLWGFAPLQRPEELKPEEELRLLKETLRGEGSFGAHVLEKARVRR